MGNMALLTLKFGSEMKEKKLASIIIGHEILIDRFKPSKRKDKAVGGSHEASSGG